MTTPVQNERFGVEVWSGPDWNYRLNGTFGAPAEGSYMRFVVLHRDTERQIFGGLLADGWEGRVTVADVLRRIGHDERMHKLDSEQAALDAGVARQGETGSDAREVARCCVGS